MLTESDKLKTNFPWTNFFSHAEVGGIRENRDERLLNVFYNFGYQINLILFNFNATEEHLKKIVYITLKTDCLILFWKKSDINVTFFILIN